MGNINVHLDDNYFNKFKELKVFLECKTNEETVEKIILLAQAHIQQQINPIRPAEKPSQATQTNGAKKAAGNGANNHG